MTPLTLAVSPRSSSTGSPTATTSSPRCCRSVRTVGGGRPWSASIVTGAPSCVLDVATGTAGVALQLVERTPARVVGVDLTEAMLRRGQANVVKAERRDRVALIAGRGERLPFRDATFDALTFTYLLRYVADPQATLTELSRVVKPGGSVASLEFLAPPNPFWRFWWWLYTRLAAPCRRTAGRREWCRVGRFLGPSISGHYRSYPLPWTVDAWEPRRTGRRRRTGS